MNYSVVVPSYRSFEAITPLLQSLAMQTLLPHQIIILRDIPRKQLTSPDNFHYRDKVRKLFPHGDCQIDIIDEESTSNFFAKKGASFLRNFGTTCVICPYMIFVDDDNVFDDDACRQLLEFWKDADHNDRNNTLVVPLQ